MKRLHLPGRPRGSSILLGLSGFIGLVLVLFWRLGSLTGGLSAHELQVARTPLGAHDILQHPLFLPLQIVRSIVFHIVPHHGVFITRLPNVLFGLAAIITFTAVVQLWYGRRTALFAGLLFACSAWTLHVSRLASYDVLYLWAVTTLLLGNILLKRSPDRIWVVAGSFFAWGVMLYIPGMVWLVSANAVLQRRLISYGYSKLSSWPRRIWVLSAGFIWLPLLLIDLARPGQLRYWVGLPVHFSPLHETLKRFAAVPVHLFVRGPEYPELWLGRAPLLDIFCLLAFVFGVYFYFRNRQAFRSRLLAIYFLIGALLVGFGGAVNLSIITPVLYLTIATGLAYLLQLWLSVFPVNPLARSIGIGLISLAVGVSCIYNLRAYFVAWPHNTATHASFHSRP